MLPATVVMALSALVAGRLVARRGPRVPLVLSGVLTAVGSYLLVGISPATSYPRLAVELAVLGAGLGLVNPPITNIGVSGMPPEQAGVASAVISATRQIGKVLGVAVLGAMLTSGYHARLAAGMPTAWALSAATRAPWLLAAACGALVAVTGFVTTASWRPARP
nr:MFS transporter [Trebonia sp.]